MKEKHIPFDKLSDFCDRILSEDECKEILDHLSSCEICREEYNNLNHAIECLHQFKKITIDNKEILIKQTLIKANRRNVYKIVRKAFIPVTAAAAIAVVMITGIIENSSYNNYKNNYIAENKSLKLPKNVIYDEFVDKKHSSGELVRFLRRNRVRVTKVTNSYIEGEATYKDYYRMKYGINPQLSVMPRYKYNSGLKLVGSGNNMNYYQPSARFGPKVKFRIIRK